jgi:arylsulfatase
VDIFTTPARIDAVDPRDFLFGESEKSAREGFPVFVADRLEGVKWRNGNVVFYDEQRDCWSPPTKLGRKAFGLITDPKEEHP